MGKKTRRSDILERTAELFDVPGIAAAGQPRVTVTGCRKIQIENHRGVLQYDENEIDVNCTGMIIKIRGNGLILDAMSDIELAATGTIFSVEFVL